MWRLAPTTTTSATPKAIPRRPTGAPGRVTPSAAHDRIWNGADDDGSGTVALMAIAKAFATSEPRPRAIAAVRLARRRRARPLGVALLRRYPTVPIDRIVGAVEHRHDRPQPRRRSSEDSTVYLVGSDRISSELHEINRDANGALDAPLTLDYEMNDPSDLEQLYYRSDHYSYAAKGVPIIFFTTGLHPDYHANTDEVCQDRVRQDDPHHPARLRNRRASCRTSIMRQCGTISGPRAGKGTRE